MMTKKMMRMRSNWNQSGIDERDQCCLLDFHLRDWSSRQQTLTIFTRSQRFVLIWQWSSSCDETESDTQRIWKREKKVHLKIDASDKRLKRVWFICELCAWIAAWWVHCVCTPPSIILRHSIQLSLPLAVGNIRCRWLSLVRGHFINIFKWLPRSVWEIFSSLSIVVVHLFFSLFTRSFFQHSMSICLLFVQHSCSTLIAWICRFVILFIYLCLFFSIRVVFSFFIICNCATVSVYISFYCSISFTVLSFLLCLRCDLSVPLCLHSMLLYVLICSGSLSIRSCVWMWVCHVKCSDNHNILFYWLLFI